MKTLTRVEARNLTLQRGARLLLGGLSFEARAGEAIAVTGDNGAGKTSLLRAIAGLIRPAGGEIGFFDAGGAMEPDGARREHVHLLGHQDGLTAGRTAREELLFATRWTGGSAAAAASGAERLGIERMLDLPVRHLSAGQRRRLSLVRLLAAPRALWLLDEPLTPLDGDSRAVFAEAMKAHLTGGGIIIAAIHDPLPISAREVAVAG